LAKYFSRRHIEIANVRHILVSGFYAFVIFAVGLITIGILFVLFHLARFMSTCNRIAKKLELKAEEISNEAEELVKDVRESFLFRLLFPRTKKARTRRK
jgi:branched-subunit amino acid aminotransferase/4-amino-4-deoxychorismate lyase